jgi:DNA-binding MarR family transcriptional regulator
MMTEPAELGDELMRASAALRRLVRRRLRPSLPEPQLRGAQLELLWVVEDRPGIGVAAAARELHLAANSVSTLVNQLLEHGLLTRVVDPEDRRAVRLHLTETATRRLADWRTARGELVGAGVASLSEADQRALVEAVPALHKLLAALAEADQR